MSKSTQTPVTPKPRRKRKGNKHQSRVPAELIEQLFSLMDEPSSEFGASDGLLSELTGALVNRVLEEELSAHLDYEAGDEPPDGQSNRRNGYRKKTVRSNSGKMELAIPRDREGSFEPQIVERHQRSFKGFDDKIMSMYARGMTTRDIQGHLKHVHRKATAST